MGALLDVFNVLHEPTAVFTRVKEKPRVLIPWLVVSALLMVVGVVMRPYQAAAMDALRASLPPEQAARMGSGGQSMLRVLIGTPIVVLLGLAIGSGLLWVGTSLTGAAGQYKTLFRVLAYSYITFVIYSALTAVVLSIRGVGSITSIQDMRVPLGLDLLAPGAGLFLGTILNGINPIGIWGVWLCGTGVSVTHDVSRKAGIAVTAGAYLFALILQAAPTPPFATRPRSTSRRRRAAPGPTSSATSTRCSTTPATPSS